ncbi:MAG: hypothetical protein WC340_02765 [Kiritimatiellia bacterium]
MITAFTSHANTSYMRNTGSYMYGNRGHEVVWEQSICCGVLTHDGCVDAIASDVEATADKAGIVSDERLISIVIPDSKWTPEAKKRLGDLVVKAALKTITHEEQSELRKLQAIRRANISSRTYEEIIRNAELDRRLEKLTKALKEYVNYLPC